MQKQYPITVKLDVYITDGDQVGAASFVHGFGTVPTDDQMAGILEKVKAQIPDGFRLMNRAESTMHYLREEKGYRGPNMVIPSDKMAEWHDPETDIDFSAVGDGPDFDEEDG